MGGDPASSTAMGGGRRGGGGGKGRILGAVGLSYSISQAGLGWEGGCIFISPPPPPCPWRKFGREWSGAGGRYFYFRAALQRGAGSGAVCHGSCWRGPTLPAKTHPGPGSTTQGCPREPRGAQRPPHRDRLHLSGVSNPHFEPCKGGGSPHHLVREGRRLSLSGDGETEAQSQKGAIPPRLGEVFKTARGLEGATSLKTVFGVSFSVFGICSQKRG